MRPPLPSRSRQGSTIISTTSSKNDRLPLAAASGSAQFILPPRAVSSCHSTGNMTGVPYSVSSSVSVPNTSVESNNAIIRMGGQEVLNLREVLRPTTTTLPQEPTRQEVDGINIASDDPDLRCIHRNPMSTFYRGVIAVRNASAERMRELIKSMINIPEENEAYSSDEEIGCGGDDDDETLQFLRSEIRARTAQPSDRNPDYLNRDCKGIRPVTAYEDFRKRLESDNSDLGGGFLVACKSQTNLLNSASKTESLDSLSSTDTQHISVTSSDHRGYPVNSVSENNHLKLRSPNVLKIAKSKVDSNSA